MSQLFLVKDTVGAGAICPGTAHGVKYLVYHLDNDAQLSADCYWNIVDCNGQWAFRNASTGQYLSYTPAKDYETYVRLTLANQLTGSEKWTMGIYDNAFNIYHTDDAPYYLNLNTSTRMMETYNGDGHNSAMCYSFIDEEGNSLEVPTATGLSSYIDSLAMDGQTVCYDGGTGRYLLPLPAGIAKGGTYSPTTTYKQADEAAYTFQVTAETGSTTNGVAFANVRTGQKYVLHLLRNGVEVAQENLELTNLPIVEVNVEQANATEYKIGSLRITHLPELGQKVTAEKLRAKVRYRGATTLNYPKRSMNIKLIDGAGEDLDSTLFQIRKDNSWIMDAMSIDCIKMRNRICFDLWNELSKTPYETDYENRNGTKGQFVEVLLNGQYNGIYCFTDKINRKLLNLKKVQDEGGVVTVRGLLYKSNLWDNTSLNTDNLLPGASMDTVSWNNWELQYPDDYPGQSAWAPLYNLYGVCSSDSMKTAFANYFYVDNAASFHTFVLALNLIDNGNKNLFLSVRNLNKGHQFLITPWDMDTSLGGYFDGRFFGGTYDETPISDMRVNSNNPFINAWSQNIGDYRALMASTWLQWRNGAMSTDSIEAKLARYANLFLECGAWAREYKCWNITNGCPVVEDLSQEIKYIGTWYANRIKLMDKYFQPYYNGIRNISVDTAPSDKIYSIDGRLVRKGSSSLEGLPHGVYIIGNRKVLK